MADYCITAAYIQCADGVPLLYRQAGKNNSDLLRHNGRRNRIHVEIVFKFLLRHSPDNYLRRMAKVIIKGFKIIDIHQYHG